VSSRDSADGLAKLHARSRGRGANPLVYWLVRGIVQPIFHLYFRLSRIGREHIPAGPAIFCSNHRSFLDPFVIGTITRRPMYYVAKSELFRNPAVAWLLGALGAFPVHRGAGDRDMLETAKAILARGDSVLIFAEGTRVRPGALGRPKRGVGRLALESGAPVVPVAVIGTEAVRRGWIFRPHKVRIRIGRPLTFPRAEKASPQLAAAVTDRIWPHVMLQWEWLGGLPPLRRAAVIGAGEPGATLAAMLARAGLQVDLAAGPRDHADILAATRRAGAVSLPDGVSVLRAPELELSRHDLVCFAVPPATLPAAVAEHAAHIPSRAGVLVLPQGPVGPLAALPAAYVAERTESWAVGALAGPLHGALEGGASLVLGARDPAFRRQVADALTAAGFDIAGTPDVTGVELAAIATRAAALAATAAAPAGAAAAGSAAGKVFGEVQALASTAGARPETFAGVAGAGDLVATLAAAGPPPGDAAAWVGLLADRARSDGVEAPALRGLANLVEGRVTRERWTAALTAPRPRPAREKVRAA
jgi:glycerol-3-phosphate dehydrogenase (NAD(P)+)